MESSPVSPQSSPRSRRRLPKAIFLLAAITIACLITTYALEMAPRYINVAVSLPPDDNGPSYWWQRIYSTFPDIGFRYYLTRLEGILVYHKQPQAESANVVAGHFDSRLAEVGWARHPATAPCDILLPEAYFLPYVEKPPEQGWTAYRRQGFDPPLGSSTGDLICLAIWETSPGVFRVVFLAARPSPLTVFLDEIQ